MWDSWHCNQSKPKTLFSQVIIYYLKIVYWNLPCFLACFEASWISLESPSYLALSLGFIFIIFILQLLIPNDLLCFWPFSIGLKILNRNRGMMSSEMHLHNPFPILRLHPSFGREILQELQNQLNTAFLGKYQKNLDWDKGKPWQRARFYELLLPTPWTLSSLPTRKKAILQCCLCLRTWNIMRLVLSKSAQSKGWQYINLKARKRNGRIRTPKIISQSRAARKKNSWTVKKCLQNTWIHIPSTGLSLTLAQ